MIATELGLILGVFPTVFKEGILVIFQSTVIMVLVCS